MIWGNEMYFGYKRELGPELDVSAGSEDALILQKLRIHQGTSGI